MSDEEREKGEKLISEYIGDRSESEKFKKPDSKFTKIQLALLLGGIIGFIVFAGGIIYLVLGFFNWLSGLPFF